MADRIIAQRAHARSEEPTPTSSVNDTPETSAVAETVLHQALRGAALPPPIYDHHWDAPPAGSFDAGVARVLAEDHSVDWVHWIRANEYRIVGDFPDHISRLGEEVRQSYGFARYAMMLTSGIRTAMEEGDSEAELQEGAEKDISRLAAVAFYAGWLMGQEHQEAKMNARTTKGTVEELVELMTRKIHFGADDGVFNSREYWTPEQIREAKNIARRHELPDETNPDGSYKDE